jgi:hypothetical protein
MTLRSQEARVSRSAVLGEWTWETVVMVVKSSMPWSESRVSRCSLPSALSLSNSSGSSTLA